MCSYVRLIGYVIRTFIHNYFSRKQMNANVFIHALPNRKIGLKGIWLKMSWMPKVTQTKYLKFAHKCAHQCVVILALFLHYLFWSNCLLHKTPNCFSNYVCKIISLSTLNMKVKLSDMLVQVQCGMKLGKQNFW